MDIDSVTLLIASLVSPIVLVFVKVPLPEVVPVMRTVILTFAHSLLVLLVFRIILVRARGIHGRRRYSTNRGSRDTRKHRYRQNPTGDLPGDGG